MELTKEYFDEKFGEVDKRFNNVLLEIGEKFGSFKAEILSTMDAKLENQRLEMQRFVIQGFEHHQTWVKEEFKEWIKPYDVRTDVSKMKTDITDLKPHKKALA